MGGRKNDGGDSLAALTNSILRRHRFNHTVQVISDEIRDWMYCRCVPNLAWYP
jgi:hypothetical protein